MSETTDQIALMSLINQLAGLDEFGNPTQAAPRYPALRWVFHPAGERQSKAETIRAARMGQRAGLPDILFAQPYYDSATNTQYSGIAIELKTATGRVRPEQDAWLKQLQRAGWFVAICREWTDAARLLIKWVGGDPREVGL